METLAGLRPYAGCGCFEEESSRIVKGFQWTSSWMGIRRCATCHIIRRQKDFSKNQWLKKPGLSSCLKCVQIDSRTIYECGLCCKVHFSENELNHHLQTHSPRKVACPVCRERRFRSTTQAVQHIESGFCRGCIGQENARNIIYRFTSSEPAMRRYLTEDGILIMTVEGLELYPIAVPGKPYQCPACTRSFEHLSQLLQHCDYKHTRPVYIKEP